MNLKGCNKIIKLRQSVESREVKSKGEQGLQNPSSPPKLKRHQLSVNCEPSQLKYECFVTPEPWRDKRKSQNVLEQEELVHKMGAPYMK